MKIIVLENNVVDQDTVNKGLSLAQNLLATIGLSISFDTKITTKQFKVLPPVTYMTTTTSYVDPVQILSETPVGYDLSLLIYDWTKVGQPQPTNPVDNGTQCIQIPIQWYVTYPEVLSEFILHELSHYFAIKYGKQDLTHFKYQNLAFSQKSNEDYYLFCIKNIMSTQVNTPVYKYFKQSEIVGLKSSLVSLLDNARGIAGIPFNITSGFRTVEQNTQAGGVPNSAHLTGEAVDIACSDSTSRLKIVSALLKVGFTRIEVAPLHIHVDISTTLPQNVMFLGSD